MKHLRPVLSLAVVALGATVIVHSIAASYGLLPLFPYLDHLTLQAQFFAAVDAGHEALFAITPLRGNEHLVLFPMPLYWLDNELCAARGTLLFAVVQVVNLAVAAWLARCARRDLGLAADTTVALGTSIGAALLWSIHGVNLFWPYQVQIYVWFAAFAAAVHAAVRADREPTGGRIAATIALAAVALFSFGFGVASAVTLALFAATRWPFRRAGPVVLITAALLAGYWLLMVHVERPLPAGTTLLQRAVGAAGHFLYLLSNPPYEALQQLLPEHAANVTALAVTLLALAGTGTFAALQLRRARTAAPTVLIATLLAGTAMLAAATTAISRPELQTQGARADRYAVVAITFWLATLLAIAWRLRRRDWFVLGTAAATLPLVFVAHRADLRILRHNRAQLVAGEMAVLNGTVDAMALAVLHPDWQNPALPRILAGMRERRWSIFAGPQHDWLGKSIDAVLPRRTAPCFGFVHGRKPAVGSENALRIDGYAFDRAQGRPVDWIVLVDANGVVAGIAHRADRSAAEAVGNVLPDAEPTLDPAGWWVGYAPAAVADGLTAYAVLDDMAAPLQR